MMRVTLSAVGNSPFASILANSPQGRVARGVLANVYDKASVTISQLLVIALLTRTWGAEGMGIWLMLITIPTYVALSDFGLGNAAGVELTKHHQLGQLDRALVIFQSALAFVCVVAGLVAILIIGASSWLVLGNVASLPFEVQDIVVAILAMSLYAFFSAAMSVLTVTYRASHRFAFAMTYAGTLILIETALLAVVVTAGFGIATAALCYLGIRLAGLIIFAALLKHREQWLTFGFLHASRTEMARLLRPSLGALSLTFASALALQGAVLVLGATAGAAAVALFGPMRTIARLPLQISGLVTRPTVPEITRAIVTGNRALRDRLAKLNILFAIATTLPFAVLTTLLGNLVLHSLSGGLLQGSPVNFALLSLAVAVNAIWTAAATPLVANNDYKLFAKGYLFLSALVMLSPLLPFASPITMIAVACLLAEIVTAALVVAAIKRRHA